MLRSIAWSVTLILGSCLTSRPAAARSAGPLVATDGSHGVRLTLSLPRRTYPVNALAVATITVRNVGRVDLYLPDWPPNWGGPFSPHVRMRTASGRLIYQEQLSTFLTPTPGSDPTTYILHPGRGLTRRVRFVLQAGQVQAVERVADGYIAFSGGPGTPPPPRFTWASHVWRITSPFVAVRLTYQPPPAVRVVRRGQTVEALFSPPRGATGRPFYMDSTYCSTGPSGGWSNQHLPWTIAPHNWITIPLYPYCKQRQWWHAVIGWPDHAVAFVRYVRH